jgi:hypothetical protein
MPTAAQRTRAWTAILGAGVIMGLIGAPLLARKVYTYNDLISFHLPVRHFYAACLKAGERFDWYPGGFCGADLHAEGQAGLYHPFHRLIYRWLPLDVAFNLDVLAGYPALFVGIVCLLHRWGLGRDAACFGGLVGACGGFPLVHYMHINMVAGVAHVPWLLACIDGALRETGTRRARWALGLGLATASQLLLAHPQVVWYSAMIEASYALIVAFEPPAAIVRLIGLAAAKAAGVLAGAIQWIPTLDLARRSIRAGVSPEFLAVGSLHPANLAQLVAPYLFRSRVVAPAMRFFDIRLGPAASTLDFRTHEFGFYNGAVVTVLLGWLAVRWSRLEPRGRTLGRWCLGIAGVGLLLAVGEHSPLFGPMLRVPTFGLFRVPARAVLLVDLATAFLAALAFGDLVRLADRGERLDWWTLRPLLVVPAVALVLGLGVPSLASRRSGPLMAVYLSPSTVRVAGCALVGFTTALVMVAARGRRWAPRALVVVAALDLGVFGISYIRQVPAQTVASVIEPVPVEALQGRIKGDAYWLTMGGARMLGGANSLAPAGALDFTRPSALRIAGVGWECTRSRQGLRWRRLGAPLPRARLVAGAERSEAPNRDIDRIDPETTVLVPGPVGPLWGEPGRVRITRDRPGDLTVVAETTGRQLLVVSERQGPGWRVRVDGREAPLVPAYGDFLGCVIEPGRHRVRFRYESPSLATGRLVSALGIGWMLAAFARSWVVGRRNRSTLRGPHAARAGRRAAQDI